MADLQRIKSNVSKMVAQGAPESDIDSYIAGEGATPDALKSLSSAPAAPPVPYPTDGSPQEPGPNDPNMMAAEKYIYSTVKNVPGSAYKVGADIVHAVAHPIETGENLAALGSGVLAKFGIGHGDEKVADAVGQHFKERYGGMDNITKSFNDDPVGVLLDLSTVLTGGGAAAAKLPSVAGKVGEVAAQAGRAVDPLTAVGKVVKLGGKAAAEGLGGLTGTGGQSLRLAADAGATGGETARAFKENIRGNVAPGEVVADARSALSRMKQERGAEYRGGMKDVASDTAILDFKGIDAAVSKAEGVQKFKGQELSPKTKDIRTEMISEIEKWKKLDPKEFHTAEGIDALKQKLGDIKDAAEHGSPQRLVADKIYNSVRQTIVDQVPKYAEVMKGYEEASIVLKEIEKTLSLNKGASVDTSLRKLQSILRNNVNTNYGNRAVLADYLVSAGSPNLLTKLAGQSLSSWLPRALGHLANTGEILAAIHQLGAGNPKVAGAIAAMLPASSPRLMGEGAFKLGQASRYARPAVLAPRAVSVFGQPPLGSQ